VSKYGSYVEHCWSFSSFKQWDAQTRQFGGCEKVDFHDSSKPIATGVFERSNCTGAGIIDQHI
jgi:hypothetical protein